MKEWDLAIESFQSTLDDLLYKTPDIAYNNMGLAYYYKGEYQKAINSYHMALKALPSYAACHTNLGIAYEALKRWDKAIEVYKKAIQYSPATPAPYIRLGRLYGSLNRKDEALRVLKQVLDMVKEGPVAEDVRRLIREVGK